ncbi:MAG: hypothetical protein GY810_12850 [Aureispira sp.]|nr:hypothetical protein [Aureispira sp.]
MKYFILLLALSGSFLAYTANEHPIYVSVAEIEYKPKTQSIEIALKVFADDLEHALAKTKGQEIEIATTKEHPKATDFIVEYIQKHFSLSIDSTPLEYKYIGRETDDKDIFALWLYLKVENTPPSAETLTVRNDILISFFRTQNNIITYKQDKTIRRYSLYKGHTSTTIPLN